MNDPSIAQPKEQSFLSAVIYVHNAEFYIGTFLASVIEALEAHFEHTEIILVNDASEDNSLDVSRETGKNARTSSISVVNMSYFHGLELSMDAGVDMAIGDFVLEFDYPLLDFDPDVIMKVYLKCLDGFDIVSASPNKKSRLSSSLFYYVFDQFSNNNRMTTESFRILSRRVINRISSVNKSIYYRKAVYTSAGLKCCNLVYQPTNNVIIHQDKKDKHFRLRLAVDSLILFTDIGYRFSITMTFLMMIASIIMIAYTIVVYFAIHPVAGWTTTILFLSVGLFGLFGILTIVIKYLQLLVDMVYKRKHYSFEDIEKITK